MAESVGCCAPGPTVHPAEQTLLQVSTTTRCAHESDARAACFGMLAATPAVVCHIAQVLGLCSLWQRFAMPPKAKIGKATAAPTITDREELVAAILRDYKALQNASDELCADRERILCEVRKYGKDSECAVWHCTHGHDAFGVWEDGDPCGGSYLTPDDGGDSVLRVDGRVLQAFWIAYLQQAAKPHPEEGTLCDYVEMHVRDNPLALEFVTGDLRNDRRILEAAVLENPHALRFAPEHLRADKKLVIKAFEYGLAHGPIRAGALQYVSADLRADRDVVLAALESAKKWGPKDGGALQYASADLRADHDVVLAALESDKDALQFASPELQTKLKKAAANVPLYLRQRQHNKEREQAKVAKAAAAAARQADDALRRNQRCMDREQAKVAKATAKQADGASKKRSGTTTHRASKAAKRA